jgi:thiamine biosynthesis lipoprotein
VHAIELAVLLALSPAGALQTETRPAFASLATVTVVTGDRALARAGIEAAFAHLDRVDWAMNEWRDGSPLSRLNATAGEWVPLPADLCRVLAVAKEAAGRTGGLFDPTWAALSDLWRFDGSGTVPTPEALGARCPLVDHRGLELRARTGGSCDARLARRGMRVGLGGIAKGRALDGAARALRALGLRDFLVQAGGDLYAAGSRGGEPWRIAIRDPARPEGALAALDVSDRALSTTADYEHAFEAGGRRYHHVIDPRSCEPARRSRAVTVLAPSAVEAEIVGKAAFIAGGEAALAIARGWDAAVLVVTAEGEVLASPGMAGSLVPVGPAAPRPPAAAEPRRPVPDPGSPRRRRRRRSEAPPRSRTISGPPPRRRPRPEGERASGAARRAPPGAPPRPGATPRARRTPRS